MIKKLFILGSLITASFAQARWLNHNEAAISYETKTAIKVPRSGKARINTQATYRILNDEGRKMGTRRFNYAPKEKEFEIVTAEVRNGSKTIKLKSNSIVDQPIRAKALGFDDLRQVMVSFPQVQLNSELYYESEEEITHPSIEGEFTRRFNLGGDGLATQAEYKINSEVILYFAINDPTDAVELVKNENEKGYEYFIRLKKPVMHKIFDEKESLLDDRKTTWIVMSTSPSYEEMFKELALQYEKILSTEIPPLYKKMVDELKLEPLSIAKTGKLLSLLSEKVRYMGDWRPRNGGYIPRALEQIAETQSGDCKDMAIITVKLLRELGYNAWVALVFRGDNPPELSERPYMSAFNHAIVFVQFEGKKLWLDPTNFQSFPEGVFEDIGERFALVLNNQRVYIEKIEFPSSEKSQEKIERKISVGKKNVVFDSVVMEQSGTKAIRQTGILLRASKEQFEEKILNNLVSRSEILNYKMKVPDLSSRIVKPVRVEVEIEKELNPVMTSVGEAFDISTPEWIRDLSKIPTVGREAGIRLAVPTQSAYIMTYENIRMVGKALKSCKVTSPWFDYAYTVKQKPLQVIRKYDIKRYAITPEEVQSKEFSNFQAQLKECVQKRYLVYEKR